MKFWNAYPLFRLIIPLIAGIILILISQIYVNPILLIATTLLFLIFCILSNQFLNHKYRWLFGVLLYLAIFLSGMTSAIIHTPKYDENHFSKLLTPDDVFIIRLTETPTERLKSIRAFGNVEYRKDSSEFKRVSGKVMLYFENDSLAKTLKYGDYIITDGIFNEIDAPLNPHQFDYKSYLAYEGIYHQAYLQCNKWIKTDKNSTNPIFKFSEVARLKMLKILEENGLGGDEYAVASALLLGYKENLEPELRNQYSGAGAMHILSVSGLHVGIIFFVISFLLQFFDKIRHSRFFKFLIILSTLWFYAFITGISPSVLRATVMFSLFAIKELRKQQSNPYNTLAASAFILIIFDPFIITKAGFQLSYAAVLGIIALFKPLYELLVFKNKIADYFWQIIAVSIAAQIGTFPISVFYFHQFPSYFLLANIFVIPLAWLIMVVGITTLFFFFWPMMAKLFGFLLKNLIFALNYSVGFIDALPGAKIEGLVYFLPHVVLIYLIFIFITRFFVEKNSSWIIATLIGMILLVASSTFEKSRNLNQKQLVVYSLKNQTAIDVFVGDKAFSIADSSVFADTKNIDFNLKNTRIFAGIHQINNYSLDGMTQKEIQYQGLSIFSTNFITCGKRRIAIIDKAYDEYQPDKPLRVDYLILRENPKVTIAGLKEKFSFDKIIFDGSNKIYSINQWIEECKNLTVSYHNVKNEGAFVTQL